MKARLLPLKDKYYGTEVEITLDSGKKYSVEVWIPDGPPSIREMDRCLEEYEGEIDYSHYESEVSLKIANTLVKAIESNLD